MATFQYQAVKMTTKMKVQGTINAESERHARELLREQELYPTALKPLKVLGRKKKEKSQSPIELWIKEKTSNVGLAEQISFTQNLEMMVRAGIPITEALLYMESYMDNPKFKRLLNTLRLDILSGFSFSRALEKHSRIFNDVYVSIIQAGESSGELESVLKRLAEMLNAQGELQKKIIAALVYPIMVIVIVCLVLAVMFIFVIPTFNDMYAKMGVKLPLITQIMVWISDFIRHFWYITIAILVGAFFGIKKFVKTEFGRYLVDSTTLKLPVVSPLVIAISLSHFVSTLHVSFSAGLPITDCIIMACKTITHTIIRAAFDEVNLKVQAGQRLAQALIETDLIPPMVIIMISTGEKSGSLEEMLIHSLKFLEVEVNQRVEVLMAMMEPVLLIVLGGVTGAMALSIYLPLFGMYDHLH
jgi:general secretion pathway protein F